MNTRLIEELEYNNCLIADGFDDAIIGISKSDEIVTVYSIEKCIDILMSNEDMCEEDALEHFYYNVSGSYVGTKTPIFIHTYNE